MAVLANINRIQIERDAPELARVFPPGTTVTRDELTAWETLDADGLTASSKPASIRGGRPRD